MARRHPHLRALAAADIEETIAHLRDTAGEAVALSFVDELERAINLITRSPNTGSLQFAYDLAIPELRARGLKRFPHVVFYVAHDDRVDIWRVLHTRRDLSGAFGPAD